MNILDFVLDEYFFEWIFWILFWIEFWIESFLGQIQWKNEFSKRIEQGYLLTLAKIYFFGQILRFGGFLGRCDQNETYHTSNEDKIEHMKATC